MGAPRTEAEVGREVEEGGAVRVVSVVNFAVAAAVGPDAERSNRRLYVMLPELFYVSSIVGSITSVLSYPLADKALH